MFQLLEMLFPPKLTPINPKDLVDDHVLDYQHRMARRGVDHNPLLAVGGRVVEGSVKLRRVLLKPPRSW